MGATQVLTGKGVKTFKAQSQSGILPRSVGWPLIIKGKPVKVDWIDELIKEKGFSLFKKRARIGTSKHIRIRPRFDQWSASGELTVISAKRNGSDSGRIG